MISLTEIADLEKRVKLWDEFPIFGNNDVRTGVYKLVPGTACSAIPSSSSYFFCSDKVVFDPTPDLNRLLTEVKSMTPEESDDRQIMAEVASRVDEIAQLASGNKAPLAHEKEDALFRDVLRLLSQGRIANPAIVAALALGTSEIKFDRWFE